MIDQLISLEQKVLKVRKQYHINATELVNLKAKNTAEANQLIEDLTAKLTETKQERNSLELQLQKVEKRNVELTNSFDSVSSDTLSLRKQLAEKTSLLDTLQTTYDGYKNETKDFRKGFNDLKTEKVELLERIEKLTKELNNVKADFSAVKDDNFDLSRELAETKKQKQQLIEKSRVAAEYAQITLDEIKNIDTVSAN